MHIIYNYKVQGSILGPLLFMIYMNDIHKVGLQFYASVFANDTKLTSMFI